MTTVTRMHSPETQVLLSVGETARAFGVSVDTIRRWERENKIRGTRTPGGQRRFAPTEIERVKQEAVAA